jgi:hypothetical protein
VIIPTVLAVSLATVRILLRTISNGSRAESDERATVRA